VPGTSLDPSLLASAPTASGAWHQIQTPCLLASDRPTAGAWHQIQNPVCYTRGTGTRGAAPRHLSTVWRQVASAREPARARCRIVAIGCQAVDSGASKASTVWRQVASAREPARARCRIVAIGCQAVDSGASKASTVWRQVATAEVPGTDLDPEFASIHHRRNGCPEPI
jgi:hypothetical protein